MLALGAGVKSGASLEVLLAQDETTSARTTAAAARSPGLDTLCSYRQERAPPARSSGLVMIRQCGSSAPIISAFVKNRRAKGWLVELRPNLTLRGYLTESPLSAFRSGRGEVEKGLIAAVLIGLGDVVDASGGPEAQRGHVFVVC